MILLVIACVSGSGDRAAYADGLRAPSYAEAHAACARVDDPEMRGDCDVAAAERFLEFGDCDAIEVDRWRDECRFVESETLGRKGDLVGALTACKASSFRAQCDDHVLGLLSVLHVQDDLPTLAAAFDALRPHLVGTRGEGQMWAHWFRNRIARSLVVDVSACPPGPCRTVAEREVGAAIREVQRQVGDAAFCAAPPPTPVWAGSDEVRTWIGQQQVRGCSPSGRGGPVPGVPIQPGAGPPTGTGRGATP